MQLQSVYSSETRYIMYIIILYTFVRYFYESIIGAYIHYSTAIIEIINAH